MPDMLEQFAEETIEEILKSLPAEKILNALSAQERLKGLSADDLLAALSPEIRAALAQRHRDDGSLPKPADGTPGSDDRKP